jgi:serine/threonine protein kinase
MADAELVLGGRYRVIDKVDCGTLADIRLAHDTLLRRNVTVKLAREGRGGATDPPGSYPPGAFKREAEMAAALQHPHVHPVYDYGAHGELEYLVMRFFNETLRQFARRFQTPTLMPLDVALPLFQSLAGAIDYLHEHSVVHGNLKPNTIVLDTESGSRPHPFVSDLGVAALGPSGIGTPLYVAPEQASGREVSGAADLFALGILLYECLTGAVPFGDGNIASILFQKSHPASGQYSARSRRPELPLGVDLVLEGLTRPEPAERYRTATAAMEDMARAFYSGQEAIEGTIFVSYAREESAYVHELARRLRALGVKVWIDQDIQPGASWDRSVEAALRSADRMLVVLSRAAVESETVQDEWSYFLDHGKSVVPLIYEPCEVPLRLRRRQRVESTRDVLGDLSRVVAVFADKTPEPGRGGERG